jgi:AraC-like DNA-binding protein
LIHSLFLYGVGYVNHKQYFTIIDFKNDLLNADKKDYSTEITKKDINNNHLKEQLIKLLETKEIFKNPDLRISDVSTLLNTNRTYISNLVNEEFNQSFADFINNYRIKYAKNILHDKKQINISISEIGYMSGFLSESSFYRVFKDKVGVSPGSYRKKFFETTKCINK